MLGALSKKALLPSCKECSVSAAREDQPALFRWRRSRAKAATIHAPSWLEWPPRAQEQPEAPPRLGPEPPSLPPSLPPPRRRHQRRTDHPRRHYSLQSHRSQTPAYHRHQKSRQPQDLQRHWIHPMPARHLRCFRPRPCDLQRRTRLPLLRLPPRRHPPRQRSSRRCGRASRCTRASPRWVYCPKHRRRPRCCRQSANLLSRMLSSDRRWWLWPRRPGRYHLRHLDPARYLHATVPDERHVHCDRTDLFGRGQMYGLHRFGAVRSPRRRSPRRVLRSRRVRPVHG